MAGIRPWLRATDVTLPRALLSLALLGCDVAPAAAAPSAAEVVRAWSDGLAEVAVYDAQLRRYGETRSYKEAQILVKERFDRRRMVKTDHAGTRPGEEFAVLKSVRLLHFTTGIYDYHQSLNYFAPLLRGPLEGKPLGPVKEAFAIGEHPAKMTLSSFEWCGSFFSEWLAAEGVLTERSFSYFDGEADAQRSLAPTKGAPWVAEDGWPIWSRGLAGYGAAGAGKRMAVRVLSSTLQARFEHKPVHWVDGFLTLRPGDDRDVVTLEVGDARTWTIEVDRSPFRRILSWHTTHGWTGRLVKNQRRAYWGESAEKDAHLRKELGL